MAEVFIHLAIILAIAFVASYIVKIFKQPIIIGYIITGVIISPFLLKLGASAEIIHVFSEFGIAFLLFIVGLHLNPKVIKETGKPSLLIALAQMILTFGLAFAVSKYLLNYPQIASIYIGIAFAFSSTIIIMKLLSDKQQLDSLHGKLATGILIVQDLVAAFVLMFISSLEGGIGFDQLALKTFVGGGSLIVVLFLFGFLALPALIKSLAKSHELLFLFSICWCFVVAALFSYFGFSIEIGALVAGVILSTSPYSTEISSKIRPLRDFFLIIFFIIIGLNIEVGNLGGILLSALILSLIALVLKPLILMILSALFGYSKRTNFLVGTTLAQISEFSLIVATLGVAVGHISKEILSVLTLAAVITITLSTYLISYSNILYKKLSKPMSIFQRKNTRKEKKLKKNYSAILFGYNRIGFSILRSLKKIRKSYLVVDFNPEVIANLSKMRVPCIYGDAFDPDFLEDLPLSKVELVVSTVPDYESNILLIENVRMYNPEAIIILRAHNIEDALEFYKKGANYVLTPHFLGGEYISKMIKDLKSEPKGYEKEKKEHIKMLEERLDKGQEHPAVEKD